ncbi:MAG TPA: caspase family protein, partial [Candidatus Aminicenantes bacterium]|nr:caspase family protein [Candidatus Aminicenantes bacterium]
VRILVIIDACHSGTVYKNSGARERVLSRPAFRPALLPMKASLIHIGACRDGEQAPAYRGGGAFTLALCEALTPDFPDDYRDLVRRIGRNLDPPHPQLALYGPGAEEFAGEKPFQLGVESPRTTAFRE